MDTSVLFINIIQLLSGNRDIMPFGEECYFML